MNYDGGILSKAIGFRFAGGFQRASVISAGSDPSMINVESATVFDARFTSQSYSFAKITFIAPLGRPHTMISTAVSVGSSRSGFRTNAAIVGRTARRTAVRI